jgi:hypothetical protein
MTAATWTPVDPGTAVFFSGDVVRATVDGHSAEGVIVDFTYDLPALYQGLPGDTANVHLSAPCGQHAVGEVVPVPCTEIEAVSE